MSILCSQPSNGSHLIRAESTSSPWTCLPSNSLAPPPTTPRSIHSACWPPAPPRPFFFFLGQERLCSNALFPGSCLTPFRCVPQRPSLPPHINYHCQAYNVSYFIYLPILLPESEAHESRQLPCFSISCTWSRGCTWVGGEDT